MSDQAQPPARKKRINSKGKGSGFEGTVAKLLTKELQPLNFIRTPGSGARVGGKNFATIGQMFGEDALKIFVGDVVPVNERQTNTKFRFSVETKFYATPDNFTALASGKANLFKWFEEAVDDASKVDKVPMLIFKWNRTETFVAIDTNHASEEMSLALSKAAMKPAITLLTYGGKPRGLDIFVIEDLLKVPAFWYDDVSEKQA